MSETTLNGWIRAANNGAHVHERLTPTPKDCVVTIGPAGLDPLVGKLTLTVTDPGRLTFSGGDSIFDVRDRGVLSLTGLVLTGATATAITNNHGGTVTLTGTKVTGNSNQGIFGGGLANSGGTMTIVDSEVSGNTAAGQGGGIANAGINSSLTVVNSRVTGNTGLFGAGMSTSGAPSWWSTPASRATSPHRTARAAGSPTARAP